MYSKQYIYVFLFVRRYVGLGFNISSWYDLS